VSNKKEYISIVVEQGKYNNDAKPLIELLLEFGWKIEYQCVDKDQSIDTRIHTGLERN